MYQDTSNVSPILQLPEELLDEIILRIKEPYTPSTTRWESVRWLKTMPSRAAATYDHTLRIFRDVEKDPRDFHDIRLTCKILHRAATRVLFRQSFTLLRPFESRDVKEMGQFIEQRGSLLKRVRFYFSPRDDLFFGDHRIPQEEINTMERFLVALPQTMENMPNIKTLMIDLPDSCVCTYNWYAMEGHRTDIPEYDTSIVDRLRTSLVSNFETLKLDRLTDLRLSMATTYDIAQLGSALSDNVCSQLKHLFLEYVDATGTGGSNKYFQYTNGRGLSVHSNLQKKYPNIRHMRGLCGLVDRCPNIESLGLAGTQHLDCDLLNWTPVKGRGLKTLYLKRARLLCNTLIRLLSLYSPSESPIFSLWLEGVELRTGNWGSVFDLLRQTPHLAYLNPLNLSYTQDSTVSNLKVFDYRPWEDKHNLWSADKNEQQVLSALVNGLVEKAGGIEKYSQGFDTTVLM